MNTKMHTSHRNKQWKERAATLLEDKQHLPKANVVIAGVAGAGKSTLINAIFGCELAKTGMGRPITREIKVWENDDVPVRIWDTMGLELSDKQVKNTINAIKGVIAGKNESKDPFDRIHAIWYCIQAVGSKFQKTESDFIKELSGLGVPFIIVLTKCISKKTDDNFEGIVKDILKNDGCDNMPIVQVLAKDWEIDEGLPVIPSKGLEKLVDVTTENLEGYIYDSFISAQTISKLLKRELAEKYILHECDNLRKEWIKAYIPIVNIFDANKRMERMFKIIGQAYNTNLSEDEIKEIYNHSIGKWKGKAFNLSNPLGHWVFKKADDFYNKYIKGQKGFEQSDRNIEDYEWAAKLIIWSGYSWILAIEQHWDDLIKADANSKKKIVEQMIEQLKKYMSVRKEKCR
uniref:G domain-containing protein n=1 Tax=Eubacterium plexicaudatum ASF492 TaxID=1235802 RepID=N2A599_9FIRM